MTLLAKLDHLHAEVRQNQWLRYFTVFNRVALAVGFGIAGWVKVAGERFASGLSVNHPMGHYLEALHHTGYYYTVIGVLQMLAALLLLLPRTALLGALLYFPIILNICVLSLAVRFEGSLISAPLMLLSNIYLLCWDYDKLKPLLLPSRPPVPPASELSRKFPARFFAGSFLAVVLLIVVVTNAYDIMPRNSFADCNRQFVGTARTQAGRTFCDCIHNQGQPLDQSLAAYDVAPDDAATAQKQP